MLKSSIINTEKLIPSKKYKSSLLITFVASILILSMLSTSVFASSPIGIDNNTYLYLMSMDAVAYAGFNNASGDVYSVASWPQTYYNSVAGDLQQGVAGNAFNFSLYGRLVNSVDLGLKPYVYVPILLQGLSELQFNFFVASNYTIGKTPSVSLEYANVIDFSGLMTSTYTVSIEDITNSIFFSTQGQAFNTIYTNGDVISGASTLYCKCYSVSIKSSSTFDCGFLRFSLYNEDYPTQLGQSTPIFYGLNNILFTMPDSQLSNMLITMQGNFSSILSSLNSINGNLNLNNQGIQSQLQQILEYDYMLEDKLEEQEQEIDSLESTMDEFKEVFDSIEKPPAEDYNMSLDDISPDYDPTVFNNTFSSFFTEGSIITSMLGIVMSTGTVGYILFGKR